MFIYYIIIPIILISLISVISVILLIFQIKKIVDYYTTKTKLQIQLRLLLENSSRLNTLEQPNEES